MSEAENGTTEAEDEERKFIPKELFVGTTRGEWPLTCFESAHHAMAWLQSGGQKKRRLWRIRISQSEELGIKIVEPHLVPISDLQDGEESIG